MRFWVRSVSGASGQSWLLPHVSGHSARWGGFCGWFMFFLGTWPSRSCAIDSAMSNMAGTLCLCHDLAFILAPGAAQHPVESEVIWGLQWGLPQVEFLTSQALRSRRGCRWIGLGPLQCGVLHPFPSVLPLMTRGEPCLPLRACKYSSGLTGSAYRACGEAASALHAMALLQVHQAKALRDLHEGGHDLAVLHELRVATDLALRATKVTAQSLGRAMSRSAISGCVSLTWRSRRRYSSWMLRVTDRPLRRRCRELCPAVFWQHRSRLRRSNTSCAGGNLLLPLWLQPLSLLVAVGAPLRPPPLPLPRCSSSLPQGGVVEPVTGRTPSPSRPPPNPAASASARGPETGDPEMEGTAHRDLALDLALVLRALLTAPCEPLQSVELKFLSMKTLLLTALASFKRMGDLQAFLVDDFCLEFGPADSSATLRPRPGYVPKVPTTPFRDQVVNLQALPLEEADPALALLCPERALRQYMDRTQSFRTSEQLFVCYGGQQKGKAVSKQRMAHWIVDAITMAYEAQGVPCPLRLRAHSTRGVASSWALARGASLADICRAAGWATPNTFARFYSLRVEPVSSCVLTLNG